MTRNRNAACFRLLKTYLRSRKVITLLLIILPFIFAYATAVSNMGLLKMPAELANYIAENQGNLLHGSSR